MNTHLKLLLSLAAASSFTVGCKQRQDTAAVKDAEGDPGQSLDTLLADAWTDLDTLGAVTSPLDAPADGTAMALVDTPAAQQILTLVGQLQAQLDSGTSMNRTVVQRLINDLTAMAQLASGDLTADQRARVNAVLARARTVLNPPTPPPPTTTPAQTLDVPPPPPPQTLDTLPPTPAPVTCDNPNGGAPMRVGQTVSVRISGGEAEFRCASSGDAVRTGGIDCDSGFHQSGLSCVRNAPPPPPTPPPNTACRNSCDARFGNCGNDIQCRINWWNCMEGCR